MSTHYENLKVSQNAPPEVIRMAYKVLCQKYHPDKNPVNKNAAEHITKIINAAYSVLSDPIERKKYDDFLRKQEEVNQTNASHQSDRQKADTQETSEKANSNQDNEANKPNTQENSSSTNTAEFRHKPISLRWYLVAIILPWLLWFTKDFGQQSTHKAVEVTKTQHSIAEQGNANEQFKRWLISKELPERTLTPEEQFAIGVAYYKGYRVIKSYVEAAKWYRLAAEQGYANAQYSLGILYANGNGVNKDYVEAAKWYRLAAEQGDTEAKAILDRLIK